VGQAADAGDLMTHFEKKFAHGARVATSLEHRQTSPTLKQSQFTDCFASLENDDINIQYDHQLKILLQHIQYDQQLKILLQQRRKVYTTDEEGV
jgi:hypothetical protein